MTMASTFKTSTHRAGLSLVEVMIAVAISAMLLVAVAAAFSATSEAIDVNDQFNRASQAARISVNQIMYHVRKCQSGVASGTSLELTTAEGERRVYSYDATTTQLTMTLPDNVPPTTYTLARNVTAAEFNTEGQTISLTVTVQIGDNKIKLSSSGMPRRTVSFN
jgi:prepilin-type N-terminal cleavage/methylation domain-containing protein